MKTLFFCAVALMTSMAAHAQNSVTPCITEVVQTSSGGTKYFDVHLLASKSNDYHTMIIIKNEDAQRTELPSLRIFHRSEEGKSKIVSIKHYETVMAYSAIQPREGFVLIEDDNETLKLKIKCYL
jgi:hypothetical protein